MRGIGHHVPLSETEDYKRILAECGKKLKMPPAPVMPVIHSNSCELPHSHREKVPGCTAPVLPFFAEATSNDVEKHYAMVHQQLSPEWKKIPEAVKAVNKEYKELMDINSWDMSSVQLMIIK